MEAFAYLQLELAHEEISGSPPNCHLPDLKGLTGNTQIYLVSLISVLLILSIAGEALAQSSSILQLDSFDPEVERIESQLKELGYFKGIPNQYFDISTTTAVERFQIDYGLKQVDGIVGSETRRELNRQTNFLSPPRQVETATSETRNNSQINSPVLSINRGNRAEVRILQRELTRRRYYSGPIDGIYGEQTESAVTQFQIDNRLQADGVAGSKTLQALGIELRGNIATRNRPYVVVVPGRDSFGVNQALETTPQAFLARSGRGEYVNAGSFSSRDYAESRAYLLRAKGFDARVVYKP